MSILRLMGDRNVLRTSLSQREECPSRGGPRHSCRCPSACGSESAWRQSCVSLNCSDCSSQWFPCLSLCKGEPPDHHHCQPPAHLFESFPRKPGSTRLPSCGHRAALPEVLLSAVCPAVSHGQRRTFQAGLTITFLERAWYVTIT